MTETKTTAAPSNPFAQFAAFDPMAAWTKLMAESFTRMAAFADHFAQVEQQAIARTSGAVASWAQMSQDAIAYSAQLSAEARKLSLDAWKKLGIAA